MTCSVLCIDFVLYGLLNTNHIALVVFDLDFIPLNFGCKIIRLKTNSNDNFFELFDGTFRIHGPGRKIRVKVIGLFATI